MIAFTPVENNKLEEKKKEEKKWSDWLMGKKITSKKKKNSLFPISKYISLIWMTLTSTLSSNFHSFLLLSASLIWTLFSSHLSFLPLPATPGHIIQQTWIIFCSSNKPSGSSHFQKRIYGKTISWLDFWFRDSMLTSTIGKRQRMTWHKLG